MENFEKKFDFDTYSVIVRKTSLVYVIGNNSYHIPTDFENTIEQFANASIKGMPKGVGKIEIKFVDRWGSSMTFVHYAPSSLEGMFDFIGKGYDVFELMDLVKNCKSKK